MFSSYPPDSPATLPVGEFGVPSWLKLMVKPMSLLAPQPMASWALGRFLKTQRSIGALQRELPSPWERQTLEGPEGSQLAVWTIGERSAPPVALAHGWNGFAAQFRHWTKTLTNTRFRWIAWDMPGHGHSTGNHSNFIEFATSIKRVADHFGPLHGTVTHSFSGAATLFALARLNLKLNRAVLIASPAEITGFLECYIKTVGLSGQTRKILLQRLEEQFAVSLTEINAWTLLGELDSIPPILCISDSADASVPLIHGRRIKESSGSRGQSIETTDLGHLGLLKDADICHRMVNFLNEQF